MKTVQTEWVSPVNRLMYLVNFLWSHKGWRYADSDRSHYSIFGVDSISSFVKPIVRRQTRHRCRVLHTCHFREEQKKNTTFPRLFLFRLSTEEPSLESRLPDSAGTALSTLWYSPLVLSFIQTKSSSLKDLQMKNSWAHLKWLKNDVMNHTITLIVISL